MEPPASGPPEHRPVLLVVEDDVLIRETLEALLTDEGYTVIVAADGAAAMSALTTIRPDLVTLDLNLPGVAGGEVLQMIRRTPALRDIKVVILSANHSIPKGIRDLAEDVVRKPFGVDELLEVVRRHVPPGSAAS